MIDTFEVSKDLLDITVVLSGSSGHAPSQCTKNVHDLGHRVDGDVEKLADQFQLTVPCCHSNLVWTNLVGHAT